MKLLYLKTIILTLLVYLAVINVTDDISIRQYILYFYALVGFVLAVYEIEKIESKGDK